MGRLILVKKIVNKVLGKGKGKRCHLRGVSAGSVERGTDHRQNSQEEVCWQKLIVAAKET